MENEEKEDLLFEVSESEDESNEKQEIDYYIEKKILDYIQNEKPNENSRNKFIFVITCFFIFVSSSVLIVVLPIYCKYSAVVNISTYSKLVTLSLVNAVFFTVSHIVGALTKQWSHTSPNHCLYLGDILKISLLFSIGSILIFWMTDESFVSCHLKDPIKGCTVVFSLLFYFVFSRKKMSLERTFCAITIIVGVFISVDFGICDKFHCYGNSNLTEVTPKLHFLYVIFYMLAHGIWVLHFVLVEVCWTSFKESSSNLNVSVLSKVSSDLNGGTENTKSSIQSLSFICQEESDEQMKKSILPKQKFNLISKSQSDKESDHSINSLSNRNKLSVPDLKNFPLTSTPNNEKDGWHAWTSGLRSNISLWEHIICCLIVFGLCWLPTLSVFHSGKEKLLVEVLSEVWNSFQCHLFWGSTSQCYYLPTITLIVSVSYVVLILCSIKVLRITQSAVTVISLMMAALPVASLFWSLFRLNENINGILVVSPAITGEAVCAVLGLPVIGIGIVLLIKSYIREFSLTI